MSNTATKTKAATGNKGGKGGNNNASSSSTNPKKNPKPKTKKQTPTNKGQQQQQQQKPQPPPKAATNPPLECAQADFEALLGDAAGLANYAEASSELLDCARYGEVDACRAILEVWSNKKEKEGQLPIVDARDAGQSTSLHKACANGHTSTVQLLLSNGALHFQNDSGNTPLHWAAGSGHAKCVKLLLDHYDALHNTTNNNASNNNNNKESSVAAVVVPRIDVLTKNSFGRSALTEGFASGDTKTVEHLLNHDSATEEKLIGGLDKKDVGEEEAGEVAGGSEDKKDNKEKEKQSIVHEFDFLRGDDTTNEDAVSSKDEEDSGSRPSVLIRELPIAHADDPFGQAPIEDTTGLGIWCASLCLSRWLASPTMTKRMKNKSILELGAGCGIPALTAAVYGAPKSVTITDLNPETIENIQHNIELNKNSVDADAAAVTTTTTTASSIDWGDETTYPSNKLDYVICSDCIYQKDIVPLLKKVVTGLLNPDEGSFLYVAPEGGRDGLPEFIAAMKTEGFECVEEEIAPDVYRENPLKSGDEEDCFLHFHELASTVYVLYEFRRC